MHRVRTSRCPGTTPDRTPRAARGRRAAGLSAAALAVALLFAALVGASFTGAFLPSGATQAHAAPFTSAFDALRADLVGRRDGEYAGTLTKAQKRELKAVLTALERIDGPHASLEDDALTLKAVAKVLAVPFRAELSGAEAGPLPSLLAGAASTLLDAAEAQFSEIAVALTGNVDPAVADAVRADRDAIRQALDAASAPGTSTLQAASRLRAAFRAASRVIAALAEGREDAASVRMSGRTIEIDITEATVGRASGSGLPAVTFTGTALNPVTGRVETMFVFVEGDVGETIDIEPYTIFGTRPYVLFGRFAPDSTDADYFFSQFSPKSNAVITAFDETTGFVTGNFSAFLQREGRDKLTMTQGRFRITRTPPGP